MNFLQRTRRWLQDIEYYSATRRQNRWDRLMSRSLIWSLGVGFLAALLLNWTVVRRDQAGSLLGKLYYTDDEKLVAEPTNPDPQSQAWKGVRLYATFTAIAETASWGWPAASRVSEGGVRFETSRVGEWSAYEFEERNAMIHALEVEAVRAARLQVTGQLNTRVLGLLRVEPRVSYQWWGLIFNAFACWPILYGIAALGIVVARAASLLLRERTSQIRQSRRARGLCPHCSHSVEGNIGSLRCPECGEVLF